MFIAIRLCCSMLVIDGFSRQIDVMIDVQRLLTRLKHFKGHGT